MLTLIYIIQIFTILKANNVISAFNWICWVDIFNLFDIFALICTIRKLFFPEYFNENACSYVCHYNTHSLQFNQDNLAMDFSKPVNYANHNFRVDSKKATIHPIYDISHYSYHFNATSVWKLSAWRNNEKWKVSNNL